MKIFLNIETQVQLNMKIFEMNKVSLSILFVLISQIVFAQDYHSQFQEYCQSNDTIKQLEVLKAWESTDPINPELFISYFNYYFLKSKQEMLVMANDQPKGDALVLKDSLDQIIGYMGSEFFYDSEDIEKGHEYIDEGIKLYPKRLDMRFGKIYTLGERKKWTIFTDEIIKAIDYSVKINNNWTWTYHEKQENGKDFFLSSIQDYQLLLYNTEEDSLLKNMRQIANKILEYYPDHVVSLSNLSITYTLEKKYDKAIEALLKAEEIDSEDYIVLVNIARAYMLKGDTTKAIEYYEKVIEKGDEGISQYVKEQISILKDE